MYLIFVIFFFTFAFKGFSHSIIRLMIYWMHVFFFLNALFFMLNCLIDTYFGLWYEVKYKISSEVQPFFPMLFIKHFIPYLPYPPRPPSTTLICDASIVVWFACLLGSVFWVPYYIDFSFLYSGLHSVLVGVSYFNCYIFIINSIW